MQAQQLSSWTAPILAFCLSLVLSVTLAPTLGLVAYQQYDFWLLWFITMLILALPFTLLEIALAKRAKTTPLHAFSQLTRDADRSTKWRLISWAALLFVPFIAGAMLSFTAQQIQAVFNLDLQHSIIILICAVIAVALSMLARILLLVVALLATLGFVVISLLQSTTATWQWTGIELVEWAKVVSLTLVSAGLGAGLYWQSAVQHAKQQEKTSGIVLPIWLAQGVGLGSLVFVAEIQSTVQVVVFAVAVCALAGLLLQFIREQAVERQLPLVMQAVVVLLPVLIWAVPQTSVWFYSVLIVYGLVLCLAHAIFVGWLMKISHLRKSLNFSSEGIYNVWRMFIRIVVPLSIVVAIIGWLSTIIGG